MNWQDIAGAGLVSAIVSGAVSFGTTWLTQRQSLKKERRDRLLPQLMKFRDELSAIERKNTAGLAKFEEFTSRANSNIASVGDAEASTFVNTSILLVGELFRSSAALYQRDSYIFGTAERKRLDALIEKARARTSILARSVGGDTAPSILVELINDINTFINVLRKETEARIIQVGGI